MPNNAANIPENIKYGHPAGWWRPGYFWPSEPQRSIFLSSNTAVTYALLFGPLGSLVHGLYVRRRLAQIFDYRHEKVAALLPDSPETLVSAAKDETVCLKFR